MELHSNNPNEEYKITLIKNKIPIHILYISYREIETLKTYNQTYFDYYSRSLFDYYIIENVKDLYEFDDLKDLKSTIDNSNETKILALKNHYLETYKEVDDLYEFYFDYTDETFITYYKIHIYISYFVFYLFFIVRYGYISHKDVNIIETIEEETIEEDYYENSI